MAIESAYQNSVESRTAGYMPVFGQKKAETTASFSETLKAGQAAETAPGTGIETGGKKDPGGFLSFLFGILDVINPLQHIPVVSTIYRHLTGDEISPMARIAGDALYGGPIGAGVAVANVAVEKATGKDIGDNVLAMVMPGKKNETVLASSMNDMTPASGVSDMPPASGATDIIWNDAPADVAQNQPTEFPLPSPPPHLPVIAAEMQPASYSYKAAPPDVPMKGAAFTSALLTAAEQGTGEESPARPVNVLSVLPPQEVPAEAAETAVPPELIAYRMMDALEKYEAMKKAGL